MRVPFFSFILIALNCFAARSVATKPPALAFEARDGAYVSHGPGYALSVSPQTATLDVGGHVLTLSAAGASVNTSLDALDRMPGKANYILGANVRSSYDLYSRVEWRGVYPGINLVFHGNQAHLEYDFEIAADRDPSAIGLAFDGIDSLRIEENGDLVLSSGSLEIRQPKAAAYQQIAGIEQPVEVAYRIDGSKHVTFEIGAYDRSRALVIDPEIVFDTTYGPGLAAGLARDTQGNLYVTGSTNTPGLATANAFQRQLGSVPILCTADGGQTFTTPALAGATSVLGIAASPSAPLTAYAATPVGIFKSVDGGATWTAVASTGLAGNLFTLLADAGSATTLYAGTDQGVFISTNGGATWRAATIPNGNTLVMVAADPVNAGTVYASFLAPVGIFRSKDSGQTWAQLSIAPAQLMTQVDALAFGSGGLMIAAASQGLIISPDGGTTWNPGIASFNVDNSQALAISPANSSLVFAINPQGLQRSTDGGQTFTLALPTLAVGGRVAVDPRSPSTVWAIGNNLLYKSTDTGQTWTQLSSPYSIMPQAIFISAADSRLLIGTATQSNVFVTKWSPDGSSILYSTYLGGNGNDAPSAIAVDGSGNVYVTGSTNSPNFPTTAGAYQTKLTTPEDVFVANISPDGSRLIYSTLLGSNATEPQCCLRTGAAAIAVDSTGSAVLTGFTEGSFPVTSNAYQEPPAQSCNDLGSVGNPNLGYTFVTRMSPTGSALTYSLLFGGGCATNATSIALDASGNAWVAGATLASALPVTSDALQPLFGKASYAGFLASFSPSGALNYATYIDGPGYTSIGGIALDQSDNIYLTGETEGLSEPSSANAFQPQASASCPVFFIGPSEFVIQGNAFVLKLDSKAHTVEGLTYLGAPGCLNGTSIAVDSAGEPWIAGSAQQIDVSLQTASPFQIGIGNGFISKFGADLTRLLFSTYYNSVAGLALDSAGLAYVAGNRPMISSGALLYLDKIDPTPAAVELDSIVSVAPNVVPADLVVEFPSGSPAIAAGEILRILGRNMGPAPAASGVIQSGVVTGNVAGVEVTFDGVAAPILFAGAQEIDVIAPFEIVGKSGTTVQVVYNGMKSNPVQVAVAIGEVQILGVFNSDSTANSASNPAQAGSNMCLLIAGAGQTNPPSQDGRINTLPPASSPLSFQLGGVFGSGPNPAITFVGAAPNLAAGILQVNFSAPQQTGMDVELSALNGSGQLAGIVLFNIYVK